MRTKLLSLVLLIAVSFSSLAQDKESLKMSAGKMVNLIINNEHDVLINLIYPKAFEYVSKDEIHASLKGLTSNDEYEVKMHNIPPNFNFDAIKKIDRVFYCVFDYDTKMSITFNSTVPDNEQQALGDRFRKILKTDDLAFDPRNNSIELKTRAKALAIADDLTKYQWYFILDLENSPLPELIIQESTRAELGLTNSADENTATGSTRTTTKADKYKQEEKEKEAKGKQKKKQ